MKNVNRTNNAVIYLFSFFSFFIYLFIYLFIFFEIEIEIQFMCLLVEMCELLVNLRCVVTKVIKK